MLYRPMTTGIFQRKPRSGSLRVGGTGLAGNRFVLAQQGDTRTVTHGNDVIDRGQGPDGTGTYRPEYDWQRAPQNAIQAPAGQTVLRGLLQPNAEAYTSAPTGQVIAQQNQAMNQRNRLAAGMAAAGGVAGLARGNLAANQAAMAMRSAPGLAMQDARNASDMEQYKFASPLARARMDRKGMERESGRRFDSAISMQRDVGLAPVAVEQSRGTNALALQPLINQGASGVETIRQGGAASVETIRQGGETERAKPGVVMGPDGNPIGLSGNATPLPVTTRAPIPVKVKEPGKYGGESYTVIDPATGQPIPQAPLDPAAVQAGVDRVTSMWKQKKGGFWNAGDFRGNDQDAVAELEQAWMAQTGLPLEQAPWNAGKGLNSNPPAPAAAPAPSQGGNAPDGTRAKLKDGTVVEKRGGKWVPVQ